MALKTISLEQEINPWEAQAARFDFAAQKLNLDEGLMKVLRYPTREIILHIPVSSTMATSRSLPAFGCSTRLPEVRPRAACATLPMSRWTRCAPWPVG